MSNKMICKTDREITISGVTIPKGFEYKASGYKWVLNILGLNTGAFHCSKKVAFHDYCYKTKEMPREWIEKEWLIMNLRSEKVYKALIIYTATYIGGWFIWRFK